MHAVVVAEAVEQIGVDGVVDAVVERRDRRRAQDDDDARRVGADARQDAGVGLEVVEEVLLLEPRVLPQLARACAVALQALGRDRVGHDHAPCEAAADHVLERRPLVVEEVDRGDAQRARHDRQVVRAVGRREIEAGPRARPAPQRRGAPGQAAQLAAGRAPAVRADGQGVEAGDLVPARASARSRAP